jgi:hypothetical protein
MKNLYALCATAVFRRPGNRIKLLVFIFSFLLISRISIAQQTNAAYTRSYLNNVVELSLSDYGVITGEDSLHLYFIAVREAKHERIMPTLKTVKFYGGRYKTKASKLSEVRFGIYTVVLYQAVKPTENDWQRYYFYSLSHKQGKLSTFRDKWLSDKIWAVYETKIEVMKPPSKKGSNLYTLKVPLEAGVARGMPLVNNEGFMAGLFAESTLGKKIVKAIDMKDIAEALYIVAGNNCHYLSMVEWGQTDTRCVLEQLAKEAAEEKARLEAQAKIKAPVEANKPEEPADTATTTRKARKDHFIDYGINANMVAAPLLSNNADKDNYFGTRSFHAGISLHFNIDKKGLNRLTVKPRYGKFYERNDGNIWASPGEDVRILISSYQYVEMPVILERQLFSAGKYSMSIGAGYAPAWVFNHTYKWVDKAATNYSVQKVPNTGSSPLMHRLIGELYLYESKSIRFGAVYMQDLSGYPNNKYVLPVNNVDYTPFADRKKGWYVGVELGIRLRGGWGSK